jgi:hypothetical protein
MIILYNPQNSPNKKAVLPMSLLAVGALLEGRHEYRIVDGNLEASGLEALDRHIGESGVTLLGMTVMPGPQLADALTVCRERRRRHPALRIAWGGYFTTMHPKVVIDSGLVDYAIRGHNEASFLALADRLAHGEAVERLPGLVLPGADDAALLRSTPAFVPDVDALPIFRITASTSRAISGRPSWARRRFRTTRATAARSARIPSNSGCSTGCSPTSVPSCRAFEAERRCASRWSCPVSAQVTTTPGSRCCAISCSRWAAYTT